MATNAQRGKAITLTIPNGAKPSNSAWLSYQTSRLVNLLIFVPGTLTGTVKLQLSPDDTNWFNVNIDGGADIAMTAGDAEVIRSLPGIGYVRVNSGSNEGADRVFTLYVLNEHTGG